MERPHRAARPARAPAAYRLTRAARGLAAFGHQARHARRWPRVIGRIGPVLERVVVVRVAFDDDGPRLPVAVQQPRDRGGDRASDHPEAVDEREERSEPALLPHVQPFVAFDQRPARLVLDVARVGDRVADREREPLAGREAVAVHVPVLPAAEVGEVAGVAAPAQRVDGKRGSHVDESPGRVERGTGPPGCAPPVVDAAPTRDHPVRAREDRAHRCEAEREEDQAAQHRAAGTDHRRFYNSRPACHSARKSIVSAIEMWSDAPHQIDRVFKLRVPSAIPPAIATNASGIGLP